MDSNRPSPSERRRAADEAAVRRRRVSVAIGGVGLTVLFGGAVASLLFASVNYLPFIGLEIVGLALIVLSFARLRRPVTGILQSSKK